MDDKEKFAAMIADKQDNPTIHELAKKFPEKTYRELERYRNEDRHQEAGACIMGEMRKDREIDWQEKYNKEHKLRQEAEGELTILKGIETNRVKEAQATSEHLQEGLDRVKKDNNDLYNRVAELMEVNESHLLLRVLTYVPYYIFLANLFLYLFSSLP